MRIHFIAIGGSAMHNLALALHYKGYQVSGSDDEIVDPARSRLEACGLLPAETGWFPSKITPELDAVILGMHARGDNPELARAKRLGIRIYSYPEFLYEQSKDKIRIVIGGSHGKTTITAMILHVLQQVGIDCDYMVGAKLEGFDVMVRLTESATFMIFEGDEYLTSSLDPRPKFHLYRPDIALISGIAWDHMNVFPTYEQYKEQFRIFAEMVPDNGTLVFCGDDPELISLITTMKGDMDKIPYTVPSYSNERGTCILRTAIGHVPLQIFGRHNLMNLEAARKICNLLEVSDTDFYNAISSFKGASNRLEQIGRNEKCIIFRDFAHAPSKLKATIEAVREQYPQNDIIACFELHTYSSLNKFFLEQYADSMDDADEALLFFSPHALTLKKLPMLDEEEIRSGFDSPYMQVFSDKEELRRKILETKPDKTSYLFMSSGTFDGLNLKELVEEILAK